jgi:hypothetical protein
MLWGRGVIMVIEAPEEEQSEQPDKELREVTFKCKYCGKHKPLDDMRTLDRYFPPVIVCSDCERKLR